MSHRLIPIRTYSVNLTEFAGPRNRASFQTVNAQAGPGHCIFPKSYYFADHESTSAWIPCSILLTGLQYFCSDKSKKVPYRKYEKGRSRLMCSYAQSDKSILFIVHTFKAWHSLCIILAVLLFWVACAADLVAINLMNKIRSVYHSSNF